MIIDYPKTFIAKLNSISYSRNPYQVFNDFISLATGALYSWKHDEQTEKEYLAVAQNYSPDELGKMAELLYIVTEAFEKIDFRAEHYEDNAGDFLGHVFMELNFRNKNIGQFFTPYNVSSLMAEMIIETKEFRENRVCKISDPCCGAGGMLIASAMIMRKLGFNYQRDAFFIGQDIDDRCARMAFIQLSLLAIPAVIICGDTIAMTCYWQRETIGYHLAEMGSRIYIEAALDLLDAEPVPGITGENSKPPEPGVITLNTFPRGYTQGELF